VTATEKYFRIPIRAGKSVDRGGIAFYSPVTQVRYRTEDARVGPKRRITIVLILESGPTARFARDGVVEASKILRKHFEPGCAIFELGHETPQTTMRSPALAIPSRAMIDPICSKS